MQDRISTQNLGSGMAFNSVTILHCTFPFCTSSKRKYGTRMVFTRLLLKQARTEFNMLFVTAYLKLSAREIYHLTDTQIKDKENNKDFHQYDTKKLN
jgi:hypothetical protein